MVGKPPLKRALLAVSSEMDILHIGDAPRTGDENLAISQNGMTSTVVTLSLCSYWTPTAG